MNDKAEAHPRYWRSLQELAQAPGFESTAGGEFPAGASEWWDELTRRNFLRLSGAALGLAGLTGCTKQRPKEILPYVNQPEHLVPGEPMLYATVMTHGGYANGILVKSHEGHPVKIDGNPEHPLTMGASDVWMQASIMGLYDPDRSQSVAHRGEISTWDLFLADLAEMTIEHTANRGAGLRLLTETITSPTLAWQMQELLRKFPGAKWHQYEPVNHDNVLEGARLAFGKPMATHYRFQNAGVIVSLESDFLSTHPARLRYAREFANGRRVNQGSETCNRLYVAESTPTVTGSVAEHRLAIGSGEIEAVAHELARRCGLALSDVPGFHNAEADRWLAGAGADLQSHCGKSLVVAGEWQPPQVHAIAHALNQHLGNFGETVFFTQPIESAATNQSESLKDLVGAIRAGSVDTLFILGGNPVHTAPADYEFGKLLSKVNRSVHLSEYLDETSALTTWHVPQAHYLESWGDARSFDGTVSIQQPLIAPLYNGKTSHELLDAFIRQQPLRSDYEIVHEFWRAKFGEGQAERAWRKALHDGFISETAFKPQAAKATVEKLPAGRPLPKGGTASLEIILRPDPNVWDGRFANNGWLQECPKPITKLTWDNALLISPTLAERKHLLTGDFVEIQVAGRTLRGPIYVCPGQAQNTITCHLGYGRNFGTVAAGLGFNGYAIRTAENLWRAPDVTMRKIDGHHDFAATQTHHDLGSPERQIYRAQTFAAFSRNSGALKNDVREPQPAETLYDPKEFSYTGYKWGMSIDLSTCIGCNACIVACDVENNIPVVGRDQVRKQRAMHWLRVDTYYEGSPENPGFNHMPVPCMHCEHAPCELVCPVEATVHDHEGLNLQVYNRCVGTRFCSNNCPYKVRRFNFFQYAKYHQPSFEPMYNPDVTVRWRGVMEKCTYCIQRISRARITAEKENRSIRDGEVRTACQQACPSEAIVFGDLNNPDSKIARLKRSPLDYSMLGELNTRPRTTYLAKVTNPKGAKAETPPAVSSVSGDRLSS